MPTEAFNKNILVCNIMYTLQTSIVHICYALNIKRAQQYSFKDIIMNKMSIWKVIHANELIDLSSTFIIHQIRKFYK